MYTYTESQSLPDADGNGPDEARVARWRFEQFSFLGFDGLDSLLLAVSDADLNSARTLMAGGCSTSLALKILL